MSVIATPIEKWRPASEAELRIARERITAHAQNIESWNRYNRSHFASGNFSKVYSESRLAFWTKVVMLEKVP